MFRNFVAAVLIVSAFGGCVTTQDHKVAAYSIEQLQNNLGVQGVAFNADESAHAK